MFPLVGLQGAVGESEMWRSFRLSIYLSSFRSFGRSVAGGYSFGIWQSCRFKVEFSHSELPMLDGRTLDDINARYCLLTTGGKDSIHHA